jgi:hypothetical protein
MGGLAGGTAQVRGACLNLAPCQDKLRSEPCRIRAAAPLAASLAGQVFSSKITLWGAAAALSGNLVSFDEARGTDRLTIER